MIRKCLILQSGFITPESNDLIKSDDISAQVINSHLKLGKAVQERLSPFFFHSELNNLFALESTNSNSINNFNFRERLLKAFKEAIQLTSFFEWCLLQKDTPHLTLAHTEFMHDTFHFINNGERKISIESWLPMLEARRIHQTDPATVSFLDIYFRTQIPIYFKSYLNDYRNINPLLVRWTSHVNGFKDLICFSKIVFGKTYSRRIS
jgi:hypothetical protein